jgi:hypothetical protein
MTPLELIPPRSGAQLVVVATKDVKWQTPRVSLALALRMRLMPTLERFQPATRPVSVEVGKETLVKGEFPETTQLGARKLRTGLVWCQRHLWMFQCQDCNDGSV